MLEEGDISETITAIRGDVLAGVIDQYIAPQSLAEMWDIPGLEERLKQDFLIELPITQWLADDNKLYEEKLRERIEEAVEQAYKQKEEMVGDSVLRQFEKAIMLQSLDQHWKDHLAAMDHLRQGIHLRGYAQKNPKQEYKRESFELFSEMLENLKVDVVGILSKVQVRAEEDVEKVEEQHRKSENAPREYQHEEAEHVGGEAPQSAQVMARSEPKVGRNDPCPCGSGQKYKQCCGKLK